MECNGEGVPASHPLFQQVALTDTRAMWTDIHLISFEPAEWEQKQLVNQDLSFRDVYI